MSVDLAAQNLATARATVLEPGGLTDGDLEQVFGALMGPGVEAADLYFQVQRQEAWMLEDDMVREDRRSLDKGVGVRAMSGEQTGFAYSGEIELPALLQASGAARAITHSGAVGAPGTPVAAQGRALYDGANPLETLAADDKIALLKSVDAEARRLDPRVAQVMVSLVGVHDVVLLADTEGRLAADVRPLVRLNVNVIAEQNGRRESASAGGGARTGYAFFLDQERALSYARDAVRQAVLNLDAVDAPAGTMPVVLGPGWPGVLLHEAIGHGLEGDFNRKGTSAFSGRIGERVASPLCTVVDDGTLEGRRGSLNMDDEGTPTQCTTLIEDGILKGYMQDGLNARLSKTERTGNGRRESFAHLPMPRMTNTYMRAGPHDPGEIIESVERGLYAVNFGGGQVDITSGKFVFSASEAYLIENGKVTRPVKGATLIGNGPDVLTRVSMVGNDLKLDSGIGTCGKDGQSVPVGVGQPTLRIDALTVGGTQV